MRKFHCNISGEKGNKILTIKDEVYKEVIYYNKNRQAMV